MRIYSSFTLFIILMESKFEVVLHMKPRFIARFEAMTAHGPRFVAMIVVTCVCNSLSSSCI